MIPGASSYVDASFDTLDELRQTHGEEVNAIVQKTYDDIKKVVGKGQMDFKTASEVVSILQRQGSQLLDLANKAGQDIIGPVLDKHPEVKEKLGGSWEDIQRLTRDVGNSEVASQAKKIADDTKRRLADIFQSGFSPESISKAKDLVETKSKEIKQLMEKAGKEAWEKGSKEYQKYLDKAPDEVKKVLSPDGDSIKTLLSGSGGVAAATTIWAKVKEIGSSKAGFDEKNAKELKDLVEQKVREAKDSASSSSTFKSINLDSIWKHAQGWLKSVPGGEKALEQVQDIDVSALSKVVQSRSQDAEKLAQETYSEILQVLKDKSEKAKKLGEETKDQAKQEAKH
ncbi:hypothetical protein FRC02_010455 [Tulasnella sp. 418]|nr:hypothetical protein FRC02_010455 [Tulasnella sp. 418]